MQRLQYLVPGLGVGAENVHCTVQVQFVKTGGIYAKMRRETPGKSDPLPELRKSLMAALKTSDEMFAITLNYTIFMLLAKDPQPL